MKGQLVGAALLALLALPLSAGGAAASTLEATRVEGTVERLRPRGEWTPLSVGARVGPGERLRTGPEGRVELRSSRGSSVRLAPRSELEVSKLRVGAEKRQVGLRLRLGRLWAEVAEAPEGGSSFEVETENAVAGVQGTSFAVLAAADHSALVRVYIGTVGVRGTKGAKDYAKRARKRVPGPSRVSQAEWEEVVAAAMTEVKISALGDISPAETFEDAGDRPAWAAWDERSP